VPEAAEAAWAAANRAAHSIRSSRAWMTRLLPTSGLQQTPRGSEPFRQCSRLIKQIGRGCPGLPIALHGDSPALGREGHRLKTLAGVEVCNPVGVRAVVVQPRFVVMVVVVVDHQTMLQRLCQRLHLTLQLQRRPARHRLAEHGHQQEENRRAFHVAAQYTDGTFGARLRSESKTSRP
jgi:hypothetical protein